MGAFCAVRTTWGSTSNTWVFELLWLFHEKILELQRFWSVPGLPEVVAFVFELNVYQTECNYFVQLSFFIYMGSLCVWMPFLHNLSAQEFLNITCSNN